MAEALLVWYTSSMDKIQRRKARGGSRCEILAARLAAAAQHPEIMAQGARLLGSLGGRKGGVRGGKARMAGLTPEERRELGRRGAAVRWGKAKPGKG